MPLYKPIVNLFLSVQVNTASYCLLYDARVVSMRNTIAPDTKTKQKNYEVLFELDHKKKTDRPWSL